MQDSLVFIDSNVFLYAFSDKNHNKQQLAYRFLTELVSSIVVSTQVVNEVSVNCLKKLQLNNIQVLAIQQAFYHKYRVQILSEEVVLSATQLRERYQLSYYDSLIVAAALIGGCEILFSEDMQHDLLVEQRLHIINPFVGLNNA
jgi:predicted nucleic acid-binding protein